ncbi:MAG: zeta toxin family protein [Mycobacterium sp.]
MPGAAFVNADEIAKNRWPDETVARVYDAAKAAARTRAKLIEQGRSFVAETVFSHESKLDLICTAHDQGYTVVLVPEQLAVQRVQYRVSADGHPVPEGKARERYHRLWPLVAAAIGIVNVATVYDNSRTTGPEIVAQFAGGTQIGNLA